MHGQSKKINPARRHVFADGTRLHTKACSVQFFQQFLVDEMHLPQVWGIRTFFQNVIAMLHLFTQMRIPFNAKAGNKADRQYIGLAKGMVLAAAHSGNDAGHVISARFPNHSGFMPANLTTLPHFSVSFSMSFPNSAGELARTPPPRSARRILMVGSERAALISLLSFSTISLGVARGAAKPNHRLAS